MMIETTGLASNEGRSGDAAGPITPMAERPAVLQLAGCLEVGGAEVLACRIAEALSHRYRPVLGCLEFLGTLGERARSRGMTVHVLDKRPGIDWRVVGRLRTLFRSERIGLVHAHQYGPFFYSALARFPRTNPPILMTEHGRNQPDVRMLSHVLFNRAMLRRHDRFVAVSADVSQALDQKEAFPLDRTSVILNGIDFANLHGAAGTRGEVRHALGIDPAAPLLIMVARLDPLKDHSTALRAMAQVVEKRPEAQLLLVGAGPEADRVEREVSAMGLQRHVHLLGRRTDIPRLLGASDAFLLTSTSEGIPLALIEAMAAGLPVVATGVGGIPEVIVDGQCGLLAAAGDATTLANHILSILADPSLGQQMGQRGRARALARFSEEQMLAGYDSLYRQILSGSGTQLGNTLPEFSQVHA